MAGLPASALGQHLKDTFMRRLQVLQNCPQDPTIILHSAAILHERLKVSFQISTEISTSTRVPLNREDLLKVYRDCVLILLTKVIDKLGPHFSQPETARDLLNGASANLD